MYFSFTNQHFSFNDSSLLVKGIACSPVEVPPLVCVFYVHNPPPEASLSHSLQNIKHFLSMVCANNIPV